LSWGRNSKSMILQ